MGREAPSSWSIPTRSGSSVPEPGLAWLWPDGGDSEVSVACRGHPLVYLPRHTAVLVIGHSYGEEWWVMVPDGRIGWVYDRELLQLPPGAVPDSVQELQG